MLFYNWANPNHLLADSQGEGVALDAGDHTITATPVPTLLLAPPRVT